MSRGIKKIFTYIRYQVDEIVNFLNFNLSEIIQKACCEHIVEIFTHLQKLSQLLIIIMREELL